MDLSSLPFWAISLPTQSKKKRIHYCENFVGDQRCVQELARTPRGFARSFSKIDIYSFSAGSFFGCRFNNVICLMRAESDGLHVATSGSSLNALWTILRS